MIPLTARLVIAVVLACTLAAPAWAGEAAFDPGVARRITVEDVQRRREAGEKPIIVDARASATDVIARGAVHVPNDRLETWAKNVPKDALIVTYCT